MNKHNRIQLKQLDLEKQKGKQIKLNEISIFNKIHFEAAFLKKFKFNTNLFKLKSFLFDKIVQT